MEASVQSLFVVLSLIPGIKQITQPVFLFLCRNKDEGMPPRREPVVNPVYQQSPVFIPPVAPADVPPVPEVPAADEQQEFL